MGEHTDKIKGKIKQAIGGAIDDRRLEREGVRDENKGRAEGAVNDARNWAKKAVKSVQS